MNKIFDKPTWNKLFAGFTIVDCAILREKGFGFVLVGQESGSEGAPVTRLINIALDQPMERRAVYATGNHFKTTSIAASMTPREYVAVDLESHVYSSSNLRKGEEAAMDDLIDMSTVNGKVGIITKVVRAAGQIYALGDYRKIYRRVGTEDWVELGNEGKGVPLPDDIATSAALSSDFGFSDMSAFSGDDMYAVGGKGDVWRFDGNTWHNCCMPSKAALKTVCCAGDGIVYITEMDGSVWAGRLDKWTLIARSDIAWGYQPVDSFWFNQRLYLGGPEGLWTIDPHSKRVVPLQDIEPGAPNATNSGRLDICPEGKFMLTAGPYGACINDGSGWSRIFSAFDYRE